MPTDGAQTSARPPTELWPNRWRKMRDPTCPLKLALYGHPDAGGLREWRCFGIVRKAGFEDIENWPALFMHPKLKLWLRVVS